MTPSEIYEGENSSLHKTEESWKEKFDNEFVKYATGSGEHFRWGKKPPEIKSFIQSEIDRAVEKREKEIVDFIESESCKTGRQEIIKFIKDKN